MSKSTTLSRSRWWIILPTVFVTYSFGYLDRANFGFAALGSFCGVYLVGYLDDLTGSPAASYRLMASALVVAVALTAAVPRKAEGTR